MLGRLVGGLGLVVPRTEYRRCRAEVFEPRADPLVVVGILPGVLDDFIQELFRFLVDGRLPGGGAGLCLGGLFLREPRDILSPTRLLRRKVGSSLFGRGRRLRGAQLDDARLENPRTLVSAAKGDKVRRKSRRDSGRPAEGDADPQPQGGFFPRAHGPLGGRGRLRLLGSRLDARGLAAIQAVAFLPFPHKAPRLQVFGRDALTTTVAVDDLHLSAPALRCPSQRRREANARARPVVPLHPAVPILPATGQELQARSYLARSRGTSSSRGIRLPPGPGYAIRLHLKRPPRGHAGCA